MHGTNSTNISYKAGSRAPRMGTLPPSSDRAAVVASMANNGSHNTNTANNFGKGSEHIALANATSAITATASPGGDAGTAPTDAIIEELKALAKSMLESTNAARRRAHTLESRRSYEALMKVIEGQAAGSGGNGHSNSNSVEGGRGGGGAGAIEAGPATMMRSAALLTTAELPSISSSFAGSQKEKIVTCHVDPSTTGGAAATPTTLPTETSSRVDFGGDGAAAVAAGSEALTDVPASLSPRHSASGYTSSLQESERERERTSAGEGSSKKSKSQAAAAAKATKEGVDNHAAAAHSGEATRSSGPVTNTSLSATTAEETDNVFDGVRTQAFFKSTDVAAYNEVVSSVWKPERLKRSADGTTAPDDSDDNDDNEDDQEKNSDSSGSDEAVAHMGTRNRPARNTAKSTQVFRVPLFPFGGGVTNKEAAELSRKFTQCIRSSRHNRSLNVIPRLITKSAFDADAFGEVVANVAARVAAFTPESPYEFVVEVERPVLFNAAAAREERRREFRRLSAKGQAPVTMGAFNLRVIMDPIKTGFEDEKDFPIIRGSIIADRYRIAQLLGKATFSRAVRCYDLEQPIYDDDDEDEDEDEEEEEEEGEDGANVKHGEEKRAAAVAKSRAAQRKKKTRTPVGYAEVCLKIINNSKDFFDQSLDEIRLLTLINSHRDADEVHVIRLIDAFYYKEHTMLVTELLSDNLYEYSKYNREEEEEFYFTLPRLRRIARQLIEALAYVHSLNLIHADLKPENVLFVSHRRCTVKVIDFGSSCFLSDHLSSYIQSRSYRAPEVVFGCDYDGRIDVWSVGAILAELVTGEVLFTSETVPEMLARIVYVCGQPFPRSMLWEGRQTCSFINKFGLIYESSASKTGEDDGSGEEPYYVYTPVPDYPVTGAVHSDHDENSKDDEDDAEDADGTRKINEKKSAGKRETYSVLRDKLAVAGQKDELFFSFVKACLTLDHKKRPTTVELLSHPFIVDEKV